MKPFESLNIPLHKLNELSANTLVSHINIQFTELTDSSISATMPVNETTIQPAGILHGGASVVLAETVGSVASNLIIDRENYYCVGLEINANHIKSATPKHGQVIGTATAVHIGKSTHIWNIEIRTPQNDLVCISRLTMAVLAHRK